MNYDEMTIESLADYCFEKSGCRINTADLENRIQHLCDKYHQDKLNNLSQHLVSKDTADLKNMLVQRNIELIRNKDLGGRERRSLLYEIEITTKSLEALK